MSCMSGLVPLRDPLALPQIRRSHLIVWPFAQSGRATQAAGGVLPWLCLCLRCNSSNVGGNHSELSQRTEMAAAAASSMSAAAAAAAGTGEDGKPVESTVAKPKAAVEFFRRLLNDQITADLEIVVAGGGKFLAHRAVLAARSDELRELLAGTVSEARATLKVSRGPRKPIANPRLPRLKRPSIRRSASRPGRPPRQSPARLRRAPGICPHACPSSAGVGLARPGGAAPSLASGSRGVGPELSGEPFCIPPVPGVCCQSAAPAWAMHAVLWACVRPCRWRAAAGLCLSRA